MIDFDPEWGRAEGWSLASSHPDQSWRVIADIAGMSEKST